MNAIATKIAGEMTMSSKEIADMTDKRHDSVKRTIDTLAGKGIISHPQIVDGKKMSNGVVEKLYHIVERDSYIIVAQLSPEFTAVLVDRWREIEKTTKVEFFPIYTKPQSGSWAEQIETAANAMEEKQHLQSQKEEERIEAEKKREWAIEYNKYDDASERLTETLVWKMNHELRELIRRKAFSLALIEYGRLLMMSEVLPISPREQCNYEKIVHEKMTLMMGGMGSDVMLDAERDLIMAKDGTGFKESIKRKLNEWVEKRGLD